MGLLSPILRNVQGGGLMWWCPGCNGPHQVRAMVREPRVVTPDPDDPDWTPPREYYDVRDGWTWNGSASRPTFTPSVLVRGHWYTPKGEADERAWQAAGCPQPRPKFETADTCCHSFVVDGQMQMLGDCTHALAGQTVPIPPWPRPDWSDG